MADQFKLNASNILAFEYEQYVSAITAYSLTNPALYFQMRRNILKELKHDTVKNMYESIYSVLSTGKVPNSNAVNGVLGSGEFIPKFPSNRINDISMHIASVLADELNKVVEIILPSSHEKLASGSLTLKGRASIIDST